MSHDGSSTSDSVAAPGPGAAAGGDAHLAVILGAALALAGYLLPWFRKQDGYLWSYSGWQYADLSGGGGWTLGAIALLGAAFLAAFWTGRSKTAAVACLVCGVAGGFWASAVVAASFGTLGERSSLNDLTELPFGPGLPALALGLGLLVAMAGYQLVRHLINESAAR
ncbi:hypothetical protein QEZ54_30750 [Catellatospora sp. KI3]|uniref:hypothetical protein n=1 Tax=Catellatospora sp. KI3 TaxID=3041620 RepID=UPI00248279B9|nr:hypothetical protein [Catellatospora sp. KI3]MDI1465356.1 hypothetical protein [Catellatospora sp. KI3]